MTWDRRSARLRRVPPRRSIEALGRQPADLPLQAYRDADPVTTDYLIKEFGADGALRVLNGKPRTRPGPPADPNTIPPPGTVAIPRAHGTATGQARMRETSGG